MNYDRLKRRLIEHEGIRLKPYFCPSGKLTIGVGRNLEDKGISQDEAYTLLQHDIYECAQEVFNFLPWVKHIDELRQEILIEMCFQMGITGLLKFKEMLAYAEKGDYVNAAAEMLDSAWAIQTPERAKELAEIMKKGEVCSG